MTPIGIPEDWDDNHLLLFEEFCDLIRTPQRTVRDWRRRGIGPRWARFQGIGRLYITVAEARRFLATATTQTQLRTETPTQTPTRALTGTRTEVGTDG